MTRLVKMTILASALALASLGASDFAAAQDKTFKKCLDCAPGTGDSGAGQDQNQDSSGWRKKQFEVPDGQDGQGQNNSARRKWKAQPDDDKAEFDDNGPDQGTSSKRKWKPPQGNQYQQGDDDVVIDKRRVRQADRKWKYDSNKHERRRHKDRKFRFYFDGFWYPYAYWDQPYWDEPYRVSCREGADIVSERFNRVRIVECSGRVYTYVGSRRGDRFEIKLNSRTGRIIDAEEI